MHVHLSNRDDYDLRVATCGVSEGLEPVVDWSAFLAYLSLPDDDVPACPYCRATADAAVAILSA